MKGTLVTSFAVLTGLATALPLLARDNTIIISIKTGDGDSSTQVQVTPDVLFTTPTTAVAASLDDSSSICQAFSDSAATKPLGAPFTGAAAANFVNDGSTASVAADAITIGAFLCSTSASSLLADEAKTMTSTSSTTSSAPPTTSSSSGGNVVVTIQLEQSADQFVQGSVPGDGSTFLTAGTNFGTLGLDFEIVDATGADPNKIKCQAYWDTAATTVAGTFATEANGGDILTMDRNNPATFNAFKCSVV